MSRSMRPVDSPSAADGGQDDNVGHLIKRLLVSMARQTDGLLEPYGLTSVQCGPLMRLKMAERSTVTEVARSLEVDSGSITRLFDRLERKRLCERVRSDADRRVVEVRLTREGEAAIAGVPAIRCKVMNDHLAGFSNEEFDALNSYLLRVVENADALRTADDAAV